MKWIKEYPSFFLALLGFCLMAIGFFLSGQEYPLLSSIFGFGGWIVMASSVVVHINRYFVNKSN
jgi:hypothetical protein